MKKHKYFLLFFVLIVTIIAAQTACSGGINRVKRIAGNGQLSDYKVGLFRFYSDDVAWCNVSDKALNNAHIALLDNEGNIIQIFQSGYRMSSFYEGFGYLYNAEEILKIDKKGKVVAKADFFEQGDLLASGAGRFIVYKEEFSFDSCKYKLQALDMDGNVLDECEIKEPNGLAPLSASFVSNEFFISRNLESRLSTRTTRIYSVKKDKWYDLGEASEFTTVIGGSNTGDFGTIGHSAIFKLSGDQIQIWNKQNLFDSKMGYLKLSNIDDDEIIAFAGADNDTVDIYKIDLATMQIDYLYNSTFGEVETINTILNCTIDEIYYNKEKDALVVEFRGIDNGTYVAVLLYSRSRDSYRIVKDPILIEGSRHSSSSRATYEIDQICSEEMIIIGDTVYDYDLKPVTTLEELGLDSVIKIQKNIIYGESKALRKVVDLKGNVLVEEFSGSFE